jgi:hypothetical protein
MYRLPFQKSPSHIFLFLPPLCLYGGDPLSTHPLPLHHSSIPLPWGIKSPQDQGPPLPLMSDKAIFCYICIWNHGSLLVHSLVDGLVPGIPGWSGQSMFFLGVAITLHSSSSSASSPTEVLKFRLMVGSKHLHLHWSGTGRTSQGTAIPGSCQQRRFQDGPLKQ